MKKKYSIKDTNIFNKITNIYIFFIIVLFPLIVDKNGFSAILEFKYYSFLTVSLTYMVISIITYLYYLIIKKKNYLSNIKISKIQIIVIIFIIINIFSCILSPYFKTNNLLIGVGRGEGLITISLYCLSFLFVTIFGKFERRQLLYFSISSIMLNLIAIIQYIGFNPFDIFKGTTGTHNVSFMTTIGNVDFISAIYCILLTISFCSYIFMENSKIEKYLHLLSFTIGIFIFMIIDVDSGKVALLSVILILLPYIILKKENLYRALILLICFSAGLAINVFINPVYYYSTSSIHFDIQINYIVVLFIVLIICLVFLLKLLNGIEYDYTNNKKYIKRIYLSMLLIILLVLIFIFFVEIDNEMLSQVHNMLHGHFEDEYGTYRVFLWRRSLTLFKDFPLLGTGPDTFALRFMSKYSGDIAAIGAYSINDTAANVYLTMLINIGIIGLLDYLAFLFYQIKNGIKKMNKYSKILFIAIIAFIIQDFFNLSVVIVTPIFWITMAIHYNAIKEV